MNPLGENIDCSKYKIVSCSQGKRSTTRPHIRAAGELSSIILQEKKGGKIVLEGTIKKKDPASGSCKFNEIDHFKLNEQRYVKYVKMEYSREGENQSFYVDKEALCDAIQKAKDKMSSPEGSPRSVGDDVPDSHEPVNKSIKDIFNEKKGALALAIKNDKAKLSQLKEKIEKAGVDIDNLSEINATGLVNALGKHFEGTAPLPTSEEYQKFESHLRSLIDTL